jgi:hypothetical protein
VKYLPLSGLIRMGRLHKTGISQKTCHTNYYSMLSGKKAQDHRLIPTLKFPWSHLILSHLINCRFETIEVIILIVITGN